MSQYTFKLCIFGDGGVGKTTLTYRYCTGIFKNNSLMTIGVDFHLKKIKIEETEVSLQIWDFAGEERFRFLLPQYIRGALGGIFMYDITRYSSLMHIIDWFKILNSIEIDKFPIIIVGGKLDLEEKRAITLEDAVQTLTESDISVSGLIECSAKTGENVDDIFVQIAKLMLKNAESRKIN